MPVLKLLGRIKFRHILPDILIIVASLYLALMVRIGGDDSSLATQLSVFNKYVPIFVILRILTLTATGAYDIIWRYISVRDSLSLAYSVFISSLIIISSTYLLDMGRVPRSVFIIDAIIVLMGLAGMRIARRYLFDKALTKTINKTGRRVLIYGAGQNGRTIAGRFSTDQNLRFNVVGFVDDDKHKIGRFIGGIKVLGGLNDFPELIRRYEVQEVVIAIARPSGELIRNIVHATRPFHIQPRVMSDTTSQVTAKSPLDVMRTVELSDLLSRPSKTLDVAAIKALIHGKRVLVTGAGGSIGSELARQVSMFNPSRLILLDHSEYSLYKIDQELGDTSDDRGIVAPVLTNIIDEEHLSLVFKEYEPQIVFHAAAYKHVHLVEKNPFTSIRNNIWGTKNLVDLSKQFGVEAFVMVSTDKAVNPVGLMGATKRVCEMLVSCAGRETKQRFCSVRFGNVLGSSGSLIPLIQKQVMNGEPVTITDKDMTRYFMLIPEAVSLILNAAVVSEPGDICVLKMGEPVRIVDIVTNLITLMGKNPDDIPIIFTGKRPGEKLFEELYLSGQELNTSNPDILIVPKGDALSEDMTYDQLVATVDAIVENTYHENKEAVALVRSLIKGQLAEPEDATKSESKLSAKRGPSFVH